MTALDRIVRSTVVRVGGVRAEVRSNRAATPGSQLAVVQNVPRGVMGSTSYYVGKDQPQPEQFSSQAAIESAYLANMYVYRCVETISRSLSACAIRSGLDPSKPSSYSVNTPLARLLGPAPGSPNPEWSAQMLLRYAIAQYVITGKMAWVKGVDPTTGQITSLWPLSVQYLEPIPGPPTGNRYFSGYRYGTPGTPNFTTYDADEIVYIWRPSLKDPRQPESIVQAAQMNISVLRMIDQYDYSFMRNNAVPSTLVVTEPFAEPEQRRAFRDQFVAEFSGYSNAGKTLFMERGFDDDSDEGPGNVGDTVNVQRLGLTQKEAQQQQTRDAKIRDICVAMGVPLSVLMDSSLSKFQNADQDYRNYWTETVLPLKSELEDGINIKLAPQLGPEVAWFDISNVSALQPERIFKPEDGVQLVTANILKRDEFRNDMNLPPWAEVDPDNTPVIYPSTTKTEAGGVVPLSGSDEEEVVATDGDVTDSKPGKAAPVVDMLTAARNRRAARQVHREVRAPEARHSGADGHLPIPGGHIHPGSTRDDVHKAFTVMLTSAMQSLFAEQAKYASDRLGGRRGRKLAQGATQSADSLFDSAYWTTRTVQTLEPLLAGLDVFEGRAQFQATAGRLGTDITAATLGLLGTALAVNTTDTTALPSAVNNVFETGPQRAIDLVLNQINNRSAAPTSSSVDKKVIEQMLLRMHQRQVTAEAAIAEITAGVSQ